MASYGFPYIDVTDGARAQGFIVIQVGEGPLSLAEFSSDNDTVGGDRGGQKETGTAD